MERSLLLAMPSISIKVHSVSILPYVSVRFSLQNRFKTLSSWDMFKLVISYRNKINLT